MAEARIRVHHAGISFAVIVKPGESMSSFIARICVRREIANPATVRARSLLCVLR